MKAILVARVSTEEQREANNSLPAQTHRMEDYCQRIKFTIDERYSFDESAYRDKKKSEFDPIIEYIQSQTEKIAVCFDKVDRLSRDIFDKKIPLLYNMAIEGRIEIHFVSDGQVIHKDISAGDKFMFSVKLGLSKYYSDAISDNVIRAFNEKRRNGNTCTGQAKIGYINTIDANGKNTVMPDPERKHLIIRLFELYATGNYSMDSIMVEMRQLGLKSKKGNEISKSTIENTLKDPFYYGVAYSQKYKTSLHHNYEKLITKELFDRCQDIRKGKQGRPEKAIVKESFIFGGLMKCKNCGCSITPETKTKKNGTRFVYYSCTNGKHICKREYTNENELLVPIYSMLLKFSTISQEAQSFILSEMRVSEESEITFNRSQLLRINRDIGNIQIADENLLEKYCNPASGITSEMYDKLHQKYQDQLTHLSYEKQKYSEGKSEYEITIATVFSLANRAKEIFESSEVEEKKMLLRFLLQNPMMDSKKPHYNLESPFDLVLKMDDSKIWLGY